MKFLHSIRCVLFAALLVAGLSIGCADSPGSASLPPGCTEEVATRGKSHFAQCSICHTRDPEGNHAAGPNLYGLVGRPVGKVEGFKFSPVMRKATETWTPQHLDTYLTNPATAYPGSRMAFGGIPNQANRADLICFLARPVDAMN